MIELEFKYSVDNFPKLMGQFIEQPEIHILDTYYDNADYGLLHTGVFVRQREARIDIKYLVSEYDNSVCNEYNIKYDEFNVQNTKLLSILSKLNLAFSGATFEDFLQENKLQVLLKIDKTRKEYRSKNATICFDEVQGLGRFVEVESTFPELNDISSAKVALQEIVRQKICFGGKYLEEQTGYVELYLKRYNATAYGRCLFKG